MSLKSLFTATLMLLIALPALAAPKVTAPERSFAFGEIYQGEKVTHVFTFSNAGDAPLIIEKVRSSCGCTAAIVSKKTLLPGETGEIRTTFDSHRFRGDITKKVYLYSNDPKQQTFVFGLSASVKELFVSEPHRVSAGPLSPSEPHTRTLELTNQGESPLNITDIKVSNPLIQTKLDRTTLPPGGKGELAVTLAPGSKKRKINSYVILSTDSPLVPELRIPVFYLINVSP
ncbi:MAG: hypothetical protein C0624_02470 [Desulfuromonas sp.]|nr:MAG: hypothetical protein C0624_02470 [Desulfuromonas sp.]